MEVTILHADNLPDKAYVSIRAGEVRKQVQYKAGEQLHFDPKSGSPVRHLVVDIFEKVGSTQVNLAGLVPSAAGGRCGVVECNVGLSNARGSPAKLQLQVDLGTGATEEPAKRVSRHQAAIDAKRYLDSNAVQKLLQGMVRALLAERPPDAIDFMTSYLRDSQVAGPPLRTAWAAQPEAPGGPALAPAAPERAADCGRDPCADERACGAFPADECPDTMPDLAEKFSIAADVLRARPAVYKNLRGARTTAGTPFAVCVKTCFDVGGHPMIKTVGAVAGDAACYEDFRELFDPVIHVLHPSFDVAGGSHTTDLAWQRVSEALADLDPAGERVLSVSAHLSRNLRGFRMLPACSFEERRQVESVVTQALDSLPADLRGTYCPLRGSSSHARRPNGMSPSDEERLRAQRLLFEQPDSKVLLSSGFGRDWPDARGVFQSDGSSVAVRVNESDHLRLVAMQPGADLRRAFELLCRMHSELEASLEAAGHGFARSGRLGYLSACPSTLGTCLSVAATVRLPLLGANPRFLEFCKQLRLRVQRGSDGLCDGVWTLRNAESLGSSEVEQVNAVANGCRQLLDLEVRLEKGEQVCLEVGESDSWQKPNVFTLRVQKSHTVDLPPENRGLGESDTDGFPADECPEVLPNLSDHCSIAAEVLHRHPALYAQLRGLRTSGGTTLARCIKTGIDNKGHRMLRTLGIVAGDAECYDVFAPLFDRVIAERHPAHALGAGHPTNLDAERLCAEQLDAPLVESVTVRLSRNLRGLRFPPAATLAERREVERVVSEALLSLPDELQGRYLPLRGSSTYAAMPGGIDLATESELRRADLLMQEPDAKAVLSSGAARHWPHARGIFVSSGAKLNAYVNDADHLRLEVTGPGADVHGTFRRLCHAVELLNQAFAGAGHEVAWSDRLGFLSACPGSLGTGLCAVARVRLPQLGGRAGFRPLCERLRLQVRRAAEDKELWDVSNVDSLGSSEVDQLALVVEGARRLASLESDLARDVEVDLDSIARPTDRRDSKSSLDSVELLN